MPLDSIAGLEAKADWIRELAAYLCALALNIDVATDEMAVRAGQQIDARVEIQNQAQDRGGGARHQLLQRIVRLEGLEPLPTGRNQSHYPAELQAHIEEARL